MRRERKLLYFGLGIATGIYLSAKGCDLDYMKKKARDFLDEPSKSQVMYPRSELEERVNLTYSFQLI